MITIGLTGGIGSGKSTAAAIFRELNIPVIDADEISHQIVQPGQPVLKKIFREFGENLKLDDGSLDRDALRQIVFNKPEMRVQLEKLMHPAIRSKMQEIRRQLATPYCVMSIPLLLETKQQDLVNRILVIDCTVEKQQERVLKRPGLDKQQFHHILEAQVTRQQRLQAADDILHNEEEDLSLLRQQINELNKFYLQLANQK